MNHSESPVHEAGKNQPEAEDLLDEFDVEAHACTCRPAPPARRYVIRIDDDRLRVSVPKMPGEEILELVDKCSASYFLDQRLHGGVVREISPDDDVDFRAPGVERFVTSFKLCIEGKVYRWSEPTITREQIAELGGWNISEGVVQIDDDQNEVTLNPNQVVTLGPGCSFGKKIRWKRG
jgi:hypothetical protein